VFLMTRGLPLLFELGLTLFCLIACVQSPTIKVRNLPKWSWIVLILVFPLIGSIAWLLAGRPGAADRAQRSTGASGIDGYSSSTRPRRIGPIAPDDDPDFLRELGRLNTRHEKTEQEKAKRDNIERPEPPAD
jgi:hypothetical protein